MKKLQELEEERNRVYAKRRKQGELIQKLVSYMSGAGYDKISVKEILKDKEEVDLEDLFFVDYPEYRRDKVKEEKIIKMYQEFQSTEKYESQLLMDEFASLKPKEITTEREKKQLDVMTEIKTGKLEIKEQIKKIMKSSKISEEIRRNFDLGKIELSKILENDELIRKIYEYARVNNRKLKQLIQYLPKEFEPLKEYRELRNKYKKHEDFLKLDENGGMVRAYYQILGNMNILREKLSKGEYVNFPSLILLYEKVDQNVIIGKPTYLVGETGGGKTEFALDYARRKTGKEPILISCTENTGKRDLVSSQKFTTQEGVIVIKDLAEGLQKGAIEGRCVILDEATKLSEEQKGTLNYYLSLVSKRGQKFTTQSNGGEEKEVHNAKCV